MPLSRRPEKEHGRQERVEHDFNISKYNENICRHKSQMLPDANPDVSSPA